MKGILGAMLILVLLCETGRAETPEWTRVKTGTMLTSHMFRIRVPADWYRGEAPASNYITAAKGLRYVFAYTGPGAPPPRADNIRCEVAVLPSYPSMSNAADRIKATAGYARGLEKAGYRQGVLPVGGAAAICLLSPATERTEYVVLLEYERNVAIVHVRCPQPGARFPRAALPLLEGIKLLPPPPRPAGGKGVGEKSSNAPN